MHLVRDGNTSERPAVSYIPPYWPLLIASGLLALLLWGLVTHTPFAQTTTQAPRIIDHTVDHIVNRTVDRTVERTVERTVDEAQIDVTQTVGTAIGICASTKAVAVTSGTVYYCVTLRNSGTVPLTRHTLSSSYSNRTATFTQTLNPGQEIQVTSNILESLGVSSALLSQAVTRSLTNTMSVASTNSLAELATGQATARVVLGTVGLQVTKTVGLTDACATATGIAVTANTLVKYCVTVKNTGTLPLVSHHLSDPLVNVDAAFSMDQPIPSGQLLVIPNDLSLLSITQRLAYTVTEEVTNTVIFTSATAEGVTVSGQAQAAAVIGSTSTVLTATAGLEATQCATTASLTMVSGRAIYHCLRLRNDGTIPLTTHAIYWAQSTSTTPLLNNRIITATLPPGQSLVITSSKLAELTQASVTANATNVFTITSHSSQGMEAKARAQTQVNVGTQAFTLAKYATTTANGCVTTSPLTILADQPFYYCVVLTNTGTVPLVRYSLSEGAPVNINSTFTYTLQPGQRITLTNDFLVNTLKVTGFLGPFKTTNTFGGTLTVNAISAGNSTFAQTAAFQINVTTLTATSTTAPTPIPTLTPTISLTPSPSPTLPPTLTPTPVVVSFPPTPTPPFSINAVTTPIPGAPPPDVAPQVTDAFAPPTVDITSTLFALTVEAAATQTALVFVPPPVIDTPTPFATDTPFGPSPIETPAPTATAVITMTITPLALVVTPFPSPAAASGYLTIATQVFQVSTATLGWIWFAVGSLVFFATAGMFAGLSWQQRRQRHGVYEMHEGMSEESSLVTEPGDLEDLFAQPPPVQPSPSQSSPFPPPDDEDYWPASLR